MSQTNLLHRVVLSERHQPTGFTRHTLNGLPLQPPSELRIVQYRGDPGYYLLYCDSAGKELTDTYHDTIKSALEQAQAEFGVEPGEWQ
jgi:hypothetical protein